MAAVPDDRATAYGTPTASVNSFSNVSTWGPTGAIQPEANASCTNAISFSPM